MKLFRLCLISSISALVLGLSGAVRAEEPQFSFYTESYDQSLLKPWVKLPAQSHYQGSYFCEFGDGGGQLVINAHVKSTGGPEEKILLDAVIMGPASILEKKRIRVIEDVFVEPSGEVRSGGKVVMKACTFIHPETKKEIRGFLIGTDFFKAEE